MKQQIVAEVTSNVSKALNAYNIDEEARRRHAASFFGLKKRYRILEDQLEHERRKNGGDAQTGRRYGYNTRNNSHSHDESSPRNVQVAVSTEENSDAVDRKSDEDVVVAGKPGSQEPNWEIVGHDKIEKIAKLAFTVDGQRCMIDLPVSAVWNSKTKQTVGEMFAEQIKAFNDKKKDQDVDEKKIKNVDEKKIKDVDEKKAQDVDKEEKKESCQDVDGQAGGSQASPLDDSRVESSDKTKEALSDDFSPLTLEKITSPETDKQKIEHASKMFIEKMIKYMNEGMTIETTPKLAEAVLLESKKRRFIENDIKTLVNEFADRIKGSDETAGKFASVMGMVSDLSITPSLAVDEIIGDVIEERFNGDDSFDAALMLSAFWSERLVTDDFMKKSVERFLKPETETDIECLCELLLAVGEDILFWKRYDDVIADMKKNIDEGNTQDERVVTAINRILQAVKEPLDD